MPKHAHSTRTLSAIAMVAALATVRIAAGHIVPHNARLVKTPLRTGRVPVDPTCRFGPRFAGGQVLARLAPAGILVRAKLKGLAATCNGETLSLAITLRSTIDDCPDGECVTTDDHLSRGSCTVTNGRCTISTTWAAPYPPEAGNEMTIRACGLRHGPLEAFTCAIKEP